MNPASITKKVAVFDVRNGYADRGTEMEGFYSGYHNTRRQKTMNITILGTSGAIGHTGFTDANVPDQSGKCIIVTGANTGIGFEVSQVLAARGARVLLACRNQAKAKAAMDRIRRKTPGADLAFLPLDLADLASVRSAAELASKEPRIVVTSSGQHKDAKIEWEDLNAEKSYKWLPRYAASKLANLLFVFELDQRLQAAEAPVTVVACHPGLVGTDLGRDSMAGKVLMPLIGLFFATPAMGAWGALHAATGKIKPSGYYGPSGLRELRGPSRECSCSEQARDPKLAKRLWDVSVDMTGIDPGLPPVI